MRIATTRAARHTGPRSATALAIAIAAVLSGARAGAADLPVPCAAGACGAGGPSQWVTAGTAGLTQVGPLLTVTQTASNVTLNWRSFNIGAGGTVRFDQPDAGSVALNRIFQADPSRIAGALQANGRVYLLNQNGIVFGAGAQVNVGGLVASSLNLTPQALERGLADATNGTVRVPAFAPFTGANGQALASGAVRLDAGAVIESPRGQVLLIAPQVENRGTVSTPDGQTILAAGQRVYLTSSVGTGDADVRGLLVEVGDGGTAINGGGDGGAIGRLLADRGNVTIAAASINQAGRVSATTSTRLNGTIRLQARDTARNELSGLALVAERGGTLNFGSGSVTEVRLDTDPADRAIDQNAQARSSIFGTARDVVVQRAATLTATGGEIELTGLADQTLAPTAIGRQADAGTVRVAEGARLDAAGAIATVPVERNSLRVELRGSQLADSPLQRDGALRSQAVFVDVRQTGVRADGTPWVGSPIGDLTGDVAGVQRGVAERMTAGGSIVLQAGREARVDRGAALDVSGGRIDWTAGYVRTSQVLGADGRLYDIASADRDRVYAGLLDGNVVVGTLGDRDRDAVGTVGDLTVRNLRWGTSTSYLAPNADPRGTFQPGYVEGRDAGSVQVLAPRGSLDGDVVGRTVTGPLQGTPAPRSAAAPGSAAAVLEPFRRYAAVPGGATLVVGPTAQQLASVGTSVLPNRAIDDVWFGSGPPPAAVPAGAFVIDPRLLGVDRVANLYASANRSMTVPTGTPLTVPRGGSLALNAAVLDVRSDLTAPGGDLALGVERSLRSGTERTSLTVRAGVVLDAAARWTNDLLEVRRGGAPGAAFVDGGSITISATDGRVDLQRGALLDVSGGARLAPDGSIQAGAAGRIAVDTDSTSEAAPSTASLLATFRGYGLQSGGQLDLVVPTGICVGPCERTAPVELVAPTDAYGGQGFANVSLTATLGGLTVPAGAVVAPRQSNWILRPLAANAASGARMSAVADTGVLPDWQRAPANLTLQALNDIRSPDRTATYSDLVIGAGARLEFDPLSRVRLVTSSRLQMLGSVQAPGGSVTVRLQGGLQSNFRPDQALWLGDVARLDVAGRVVRAPSPDGLLTGRVLPGGSIRVEAARGYLITLPGSSLDASGATAPVDIRDAAGVAVRREVASAGGSIALLGFEGVLANGALRAAAGGPGAPGGSLSFTKVQGRVPAEIVYSPLNDADLVITRDRVPTVVAPGVPVPDALNRISRIAAPAIAAGGFDSLALSVNNTYATTQDGIEIAIGYGRVLFDPGVELALPGRVALTATAVGTTAAGSARVGGGYLTLGLQDDLQREVPPAVAGNGALTLSGDLVEVIGRVSTQGLRDLRLVSNGDLRLRGNFVAATRGYGGELTVAGSLALRARQVYPATLTDYALTVLPGAGRTLAVEAVPSSPDLALSALGTLTLSAPDVRIAGRVVAPAGQITVRGDTVRVLDGGVLSTSTNGQLLPFGQTQGGLAWTYPVNSPVSGSALLTRLYGADGSPLPTKRVILDGANVQLAAGGVVDVAGGGDLYAYEFVRGPTGTRDVLGAASPGDAAALATQYFAILPGAPLQFAPYDPLETAAYARNAAAGGPGGLRIGDSIALAGGGGVPAGTYALLPARYALLPGAYVVRPVPGYADLPSGQAFERRDGGTIVAGQRVFASTGSGDTRTSGFLVQPGTLVRREARYDLTGANAFFGPEGPGADSGRRPVDAGLVTVNARSGVEVAGRVNAGTSGGLGGGLELVANRLQVVAGGGTAAPGFVSVSAAQLSALSLDSLLLGGTRTDSTLRSVLQVGASEVRVDGGVTLRGGELVLVARDAVDVRAGATLQAVGAPVATPETVALDGGSALLRVATAGDPAIEREGTAGVRAGAVTVERGARLAGASLQLDAVGTARVAGDVAVANGSLWFGASRVGLGVTDANYAGLALDPASLSALNPARLTLAARDGLDVAPGATLAARSLTLATPTISGRAPGGTARVTADSLVLRGTGAGAASPSPGTTQLEFAARAVTVADGTLAFANVGAVRIAAAETFAGDGDAALASGGDLTIAAPRIVAQAGGSLGLTAAGALVATSATAAPPAATTAGAGAGVTLTGRSVRIDTTVDAPGGTIDVAATAGDLVLGANARLNAGGFRATFDGVPVDVAAGEVRLVAAAGPLVLGTGSVVDVSATDGSRAGTVALLATSGRLSLDGTLRGARDGATALGSLTVDAGALDSVAVVRSAAGFGRVVNVRLRGPGELAVPAGAVLTAREVQLAADQGGISIAGGIDASAPGGGLVRLAARDAIAIGGRVDAATTDATLRNGSRIELLSAGGVRVDGGAVLDVGGGARYADGTSGGTVLARLPRDTVLAAGGPSFTLAPAAVRGYRDLVIEGYRTYMLASGSIDFDAVDPSAANPWFADATSFAAAAAPVAARLGFAPDAPVRVRAGLQIESPGDLSLDADWDLQPWRFGGQPGALTLRAGGTLTIAATLTDGFRYDDPTATSSYELGATPIESWSYRLVAGAAVGADPLAVGRDGDLVVAAGPGGFPDVGGGVIAVRTGTGRIEAVAARDLVFENQASVLYTAGTARPGERFPLSALFGNDVPYPDRGGDVRLQAGRDVRAAGNDQFYGAWLVRLPDPVSGSARWAPSFLTFQQGVAAFGGGRMTVVAGRDVVDLGVSTPSSGVGGATVAGGNLEVVAGRDVRGGEFWSDGAIGRVAAGRRIDVGVAVASSGRGPVAPVLASGQGALDVTARRGATVLAAVNPLLQSLETGPLSLALQFANYGDRSRLDLATTSGELRFMGNTEPAAPFYSYKPNLNAQNVESTIGLRIAPPSVRLVAATDRVLIGGSTTLWPSSRGTLDVFAGRDVVFSGESASEVRLILADIPLGTVAPTIARPAEGVDTYATAFAALAAATGDVNLSRPLHGPTTPGGPRDRVPARIVALDGDVRFQSLTGIGEAGAVWSAKPLRVVASRDVFNPKLIAQNLADGDVTSVIAGRDVVYPLGRDVAGRVVVNGQEIAVDGPGLLEVIAGRDVNLQASRGITTRGNIVNPGLPAAGADVVVAAGAGDREVSVQGVLDRYLAPADATTYDAALAAYVERVTGTRPPDRNAALAAYRALPLAQRYAFAQRVTVAELREGGRFAASSPNQDFARSFTALETFFPGANPDVDAGETNPYRGDVQLYFSRVYTLAGGSVDLLAPGGEVNVGIAAPPASFGLTKGPAELGIVLYGAGNVSSVTYRDFQVNESRVFAADGGDILVWATRGDIDAGRGAKTAISAPPPTVTIGPGGQVIISQPAALTGSGIQTLATNAAREPGDVDLFAPRGIVNAGDAGIVAGNLTIAATAVVGAGNIAVSGAAVGVPVDVGGLGASIAGASGTSAGASGAAQGTMDSQQRERAAAPTADSAVTWLDVFVTGLGEENCRPDDLDCLKRQKQ
jgi:filamentous hemagglutinin family protein